MKEAEEPDFKALLEIWQVGRALDDTGMLVMPLGSLRGMIAAHLPLDELREDVRELVLDAELSDGEIVIITAETAGIIERMGEA